MNNDRNELLKEIMALDFTLLDLHLYLNTHPCDQRALCIYNNTVQKARIFRYNYERLYGPINAQMFCSKYPWQWIEQPWPWEKEV